MAANYARNWRFVQLTADDVSLTRARRDKRVPAARVDAAAGTVHREGAPPHIAARGRLGGRYTLSKHIREESRGAGSFYFRCDATRRVGTAPSFTPQQQQQQQQQHFDAFIFNGKEMDTRYDSSRQFRRGIITSV